MKKLFYLPLILAIIMTLLSSCSGGGGEDELEPLDPEKKVNIKIMFWDEQYFFQEYGNLFAAKFPNVDFEIANMTAIYSTPVSKATTTFEKFIEEQNPDVLMLDPFRYQKLAAEGKLFALDSVIKQDEFQTEGMHPAVLKLLREKGNGTLYGLSPHFDSSALFYNIDLFKKYGVELPKDSMTWEEVFELAKRFPTDGAPDTRIYGFVPDLYLTLEQFISTISQAQGLSVLNPDASQVNMNTESWKKVFQSTLDAVKSGAVYIPSEANGPPMITSQEEMYKKNLFLTGRAAMYFNSFWEVQTIMQAKEVLKYTQPVNWAVVTAPVDPNNRTQSSYFNVSNIFSVNAASPNLRASWEFVKYINSEEFAKIKSKLSRDLSTWTAYNMDQDGRNLDAFYKLEPRAFMDFDFENAPAKYYFTFTDILQSEAHEVLHDKKSVDEALQSIQDRAQTELQKARKAEAEASPSASASTNAKKP